MSSSGETNSNKIQSFSEEPPLREPAVATQRLLPRVFAGTLIVIWLLTLPAGLRALTNYSSGSTDFNEQLISSGDNYWIAREKRGDGACVGWVRINLEVEERQHVSVLGSFRMSILNQDVKVEMEGEAKLTQTLKVNQFHLTIDAGEASIKAKSTEPPITSARVTLKTRNDLRKMKVPVPSPVFLVEEFPNRFSIRTPTFTPQSTISPLENMLQSNIRELFQVEQVDSKAYETCRDTLLSAEAKSNFTENPERGHG